MRSLFILYFLITPVVVMSCAISPIYMIAEHPAEYLSRYNTVFLGEIIEISEAGKAEQLVDMQVLEIFKGKPGTTLSIRNKLTNSCSSLMTGTRTRFYMIGNYDPENQEIDMNGFPGLVSEKIARDNSLPAKLRAIRQLAARPSSFESNRD